MNGYMCSICHNWVFYNQTHYCIGGGSTAVPSAGVYPYVYSSYQPPTCEHCFCIEEEVHGKKHKKCCMCGTRKLK